MELLLGCGNRREKVLSLKDGNKEWSELVTLDWDETVKPDIVHDLAICPWPLNDNYFDEVHAYEVLEHIGDQGDWRTFFNQFYEIWRTLKPDGLLFGTCPMWDSPWAWADPGHRRVISKEAFVFLDRDAYSQIGQTSMTDYRPWWEGNFKVAYMKEDEHQFAFVLQAVK